MPTEAQITANRKNALQSTGPRTATGRKRSAKNAIKHGLLSKETLLFDENKDLFQKFAAGIRNDIKPRTPVEAFLVDALISAGWRWRRAIRAEQGLMESFVANAWAEKLNDGTTSEEEGAADKPRILGEAFDAGAHSPGLALLMRYESRHQRAFHRILNELQQYRSQVERSDTQTKLGAVRTLNPSTNSS